MNYLYLDTARASETLGLIGDDHTPQAFRWATQRDLSSRITAFCDEMLAARGLELSDLTALAVGIGPGSLTGLRVAIAFLRTIAFTRSIPLIGIDRFSWGSRHLASQGNTGTVQVLVPAFLDRVFSCRIALSKETLRATPEPTLEWKRDIAPGPEVYALDLPDGPWQALEPSIAALHSLITSAAAKPPPDLLHVGPMYVVPSQAELNFAGDPC